MNGVDLDALDKLRGAVDDLPAFPVVGFEQDNEEVLALYDDGGKSIFADCYGVDAADLVVGALTALPDLIAEARKYRAFREVVEGLAAKWLREGTAPVQSIELRRALVATLDGEQ